MGLINLIADDTKEKSRKRIPIPIHLLKTLKDIRKNQIKIEKKVDENGNPIHVDPAAMTYVFRRQAGKKWKKAGNIRKSFEDARKEAGLKHPVYGWFRFHDLRHCFVTRMRHEGVPDYVIKSITGHKTNSVFERYSNGPTEEQLKAAVEQKPTQ